MKALLSRAVLAIAASLACSIGAAETAPVDKRPVRMVIPFSAGGQLDALGRYFGEKLSGILQVPVVVDNRSGASGMIAAGYVVNQPADGKTIFFTTGGPVSIAPSLHKKMSYNPAADLTGVAMVADMPMALIVRPDSPYKTMGDLLADARARPGAISIGNTGIGAVSHLAIELLSQRLKLSFIEVPYQTTTSITDLLGGQMDVLSTSATSVEGMVSANKLRPLGTFSQKRLPTMNNAPTVAESTGVKGLEFPVWLGVMVRKGTPAGVTTQLSKALLDVCALPETTTRFRDVIVCAGPQQFDQVVADDAKRWSETISHAGIKVE